MKHITFRNILPIALVCLGLTAAAGDAEPREANAGGEPLVIAEVQDGVLAPVLSDGELKTILEDAFMAAGDRELHVMMDKVWFENHDGNHYLMTVAQNVDGEKLSSAIKLEEVAITANTSVVGIIPVAIIPYCKSISCTNDPCPMRVWEDHIECYCIAAGKCELKWRTIFLDASAATGF